MIFSRLSQFFAVPALVLAGALLSACQTTPAPSGGQSPSDDLARLGGEDVTWIYRCQDGGTITARFTGDDVRLFLPGQSVLLQRPAQSLGGHYTGRDGSGHSLTLNGSSMTLAMAQRAPRLCQGSRDPGPWERAALMGVTFRAEGHGPDWTLEMTEDPRSGVIVFQAETIGGIQNFPWQPPGQQAPKRIWNIPAQGETLTLLIADRFCHDALHQTDYPASVTVMIGGKTFQGCGRPLSDALY